MSQYKRRPWLPTAIAAALSAAIASLVLAPLVRADDRETVRQLSLFANAFDNITANYVDDVDEQELVEAAIQGMLQSLDPHSGFFNTEAFDDFTEELGGTFGGIGIQITMEDGLVLVIAPIDGTPGYEAGIRPQDLITNIDGEPVRGKTLAEAVNLMRGEIGTPITLTILRRSTDEAFDVTVERGVIPEQSVRALRLENNIAYIDLFQFTDTTAENLEREMVQLHEEVEELGEPLIGYILDLRGNPGGVLTAAVEVADKFLDRREVVSTRGKLDSDNRSLFSRNDTLAFDLPMVVLINAGSASASEIVAGALQDHRRAVLMGTRSFGKGSVQTLVPLAESTGMRLTTALYYTPSGRSIQAVGIDPDIEVAFDEAERRDLAGNVIREDYYENEIVVDGNEDGEGRESEGEREGVEGGAAAALPPQRADKRTDIDATAALIAAEFARYVSTDEEVVDVQLRAAVAYLKDLVGEDYDPTQELVIDDGEDENEDGDADSEPDQDQDTPDDAATE